MPNADIETINVEMVKPLEQYLRWGVLAAFLILLYFSQVLPWAVYAITALGMGSWYLFCNAYNLSVHLTNEKTITDIIASLGDGTLSEIDGLIEDDDED